MSKRKDRERAESGMVYRNEADFGGLVNKADWNNTHHTVSQQLESDKQKQAEVDQYIEEQRRIKNLEAQGVILVDKQGNIYIGDTVHALIIKLSSEGQVLASWNIGEAASTDVQEIAVDAEGNIYISDTFNNVVKKFRQN